MIMDFLCSDGFMIFLMVLLVVVTICFAATLIDIGVSSHQVKRFFARYGSTSGTVQEYSMTDEERHFKPRLVFFGKMTLVSSNAARIPAAYYITLDCRGGGKHYRAVYQIPKEDYKKVPLGSTVQISDDWDASGYELL